MLPNGTRVYVCTRDGTHLQGTYDELPVAMEEKAGLTDGTGATSREPTTPRGLAEVEILPFPSMAVDGDLGTPRGMGASLPALPPLVSAHGLGTPRGANGVFSIPPATLGEVEVTPEKEPPQT